MAFIRKTGKKGGLVRETPKPIDPLHREAYRIVEGHYLATKQRTGPLPRHTVVDREEAYQASKQRMINLVEKGLRYDREARS